MSESIIGEIFNFRNSMLARFSKLGERPIISIKLHPQTFQLLLHEASQRTQPDFLCTPFRERKIKIADVEVEEADPRDTRQSPL